MASGNKDTEAAVEKPSHLSPDTIAPTKSQAQDGAALSKTKSRTSTALARISTHLTTHSIRDPGPPPDGGLLAWTQVFCASLAIMNTWGFINSFGAFQTYYAIILPEPNSTISWIGSIQAWLLFFVGMFSGRALDAGWFRPTVALGIALQIIGIFTMSVARTFWQLLLTQGLCVGLGGGIFFTPVMGLVSTYFSTNRGVAIGIVTAGNAAGGVVYPVVVRQLLGKIGFGWTVRVLGFLNVASLALVLGFMKPRLPPRKAGLLIDWDAFRDTPYCIYVLGVCFLMPPVYCVFYYIASFATDKLDMSYTNSLNMVIILNGVGIPARILPGFLADRYTGVLNMLIICLFITSIILWTWLAVDSIPAYYTWTVLYGVWCAAFQSLFATVIAALSNDITKTGTRLGMALMVIGFAALTGGPISGALLNAAGGDYTAPIAWASASTTCGMLLCLIARCKKHGWKLRVKC